MKRILFYLHLLLIFYMLSIGIVNLFLLTNFTLGLFAILTSLILIFLLKSSTDDRETFGR